MRTRSILICLITILCCGIGFAQEDDGGGVQARGTLRSRSANLTNPASRNLKANKLITMAMSHSVLVTASGSMLGVDASNSALIALLRKQSAAARALLVPAVRPAGGNQNGPLLSGGSAQMLNPQPLPPRSSTPQIGAGQTMSAGGTQTFASGSSAMASKAQSGPTRHQTPDSPKAQTIGTRAPLPTQVCMAGIGNVDGQKSGLWFSPVPGPEGMFVIQGCGFGNGGGVVYLSGLHSASQIPTASQASAVTTGALSGGQTSPPPEVSLAAGGTIGSLLQQQLLGPPRRDRIVFQVSAWSDRQIVAQIDPNASGLYDTDNVTLIVKTATGRQYQAGGFSFSAARQDQVLTLLPKPSGCTSQSTGPACVPLGVNLAAASTSAGPIRPDVESPSVSLLQPGESIAVSREAGVGQFPIPASPGLSFTGGTDTYQFHFAPGFQLDPHTGVQLRHAGMDTSYCQSVNGVPAKNGNWSVNYTSTTSFQVLWEEEACWPKSALASGKPLATLDYASLSAYELQITVLGPRGVNPWAGGNLNTVPKLKQVQPTQLLHGH